MNSSLLTKDLNPDEFNDYYFLKEELKDFCRSEGLKVSGSKEDLEKRILHYLSTGKKLKESDIEGVIQLNHHQKLVLILNWVKILNAVKINENFLKKK